MILGNKSHHKYILKINSVKIEVSVDVLLLQPGTKYLRLTLVFMCSSALREKFNFCFSRAFC